MKKLCLIATILGLCFQISSGAADTLSGKTVYASAAGQPFCRDAEQLHEYLLAILKRDKEYITSLQGCTMLPARTKIVVIEDMPSGSDVMHAVRARAFGIPGGSALGYTVDIGLQDKR